MRRLLRSCVVGAVLVAAIGGGSAAAGASVSGNGAAQRATPALEICGAGPTVKRPATVILACADHGELAENLTWSSWTTARATARGIVAWHEYSAAQPGKGKWEKATADVILLDPAAEDGHGFLFTKLELRVTGSTPKYFKRDLTFDEAPMTPIPSSPAPSSSPAASLKAGAAPAVASGTLSYADIEGFWIDAGGSSASAGTYTNSQIAAAITGAESSFLPGIIQADENYANTGWGLWQITPGDELGAEDGVSEYGSDYQLLDPWNNAESAVYLYDQRGFEPWTTYNDGAYEGFLQSTSPATGLTDPGEYTQINTAPSDTPSSPAADPGGTWGPTIPGSVESPTYGVAFEANTNLLYTYDPQTNTHEDVNLGMAAGTSAAIAASPSGGYEVAFQANTGHLFMYNPQTNTDTDTNLGMAAGTSPAIAASPSGGYEVAFQANTGHLFIYNPQTDGHTDANLGMAAGTSPSIGASSSGGYEVALQADTGHLFIYNPQTDGHTDADLGMEAGTSPSITGDGTGYDVALQANTGHLFSYNPATDSHVDSGLGMKADSSPSVAPGNEIAFQASTGHLFIYQVSGNSHVDTDLGMEAGSSPSIAGSASGGYEVVFQANTDHLYTYIPSDDASTDVNLGMDTGSSPSIAVP